ncbi:MAG: hypothetical protein PUD81_00560 [Eggerthellales bacterium]|nr:hypothetical protein [Eggerthellales bacterium]
MYKTSNDRRFRRNKALLQRAFLDAVVEHGYQGLTVSEITRRPRFQDSFQERPCPAFAS